MALHSSSINKPTKLISESSNFCSTTIERDKKGKMRLLSVMGLMVLAFFAFAHGIDEKCLRPKPTGSGCIAFHLNFYYNKAARACKPFIGGCDRTGNNFRSLKECREACLR